MICSFAGQEGGRRLIVFPPSAASVCCLGVAAFVASALIINLLWIDRINVRRIGAVVLSLLGRRHFGQLCHTHAAGRLRGQTGINRERPDVDDLLAVSGWSRRLQDQPTVCRSYR